jgi:hypothetical protein
LQLTLRPVDESRLPSRAIWTGESNPPDGAEVYADGEFVGNAPATLKLSAGKHTAKVTAAGNKGCSREIFVSPDQEPKLAATLERQN